MERFVQYVVGGGLALVSGLWAITLLETWSPPWLGSAGLVLLGAVALAVGIWSEVDVDVA